MSEIQIIVIGGGKEAKKIAKQVQKLIAAQERERSLEPVKQLLKLTPDPEKRWDIVCDKAPHWAMERLVNFAAHLPGGIRRPEFERKTENGKRKTENVKKSVANGCFTPDNAQWYDKM